MMKNVVWVLAVCVVVVAAATEQEAFAAWKAHHSKAYASAAEESHAFANFQATLKRIAENNGEAQGLRAVAASPSAVNGLADLSPEEFKAKYLSGYRAAEHTVDASLAVMYDADTLSTVALDAAPTAFDWRSYASKSVTAVKDQQSCGGCWAFAATEALESQYYFATNKSVELSVQQTISCDKTDAGCGGGDLPPAFKYMASVAGIELASKYPYTSGGGNTGSCKYSAKDAVVKVDSGTPFSYAVPPCSGGSCSAQIKQEDALKVAVAAGSGLHGPPAICVNAASWQDYAGGVYTKSCSGAWNSLDHCVQLVGYNAKGSTPYWIVRNSWGTSWGANGYIYLPIGKNACGVADEVAFPHVKA